MSGAALRWKPHIIDIGVDALSSENARPDNLCAQSIEMPVEEFGLIRNDHPRKVPSCHLFDRLIIVAQIELFWLFLV